MRDAPTTSTRQARGMVVLGISVLCCAASQLLLKSAMASAGSLPSLAAFPSYLPQLITLPIVAGLALYAAGTGLWLICLTRLELSVAYPASAVQFLLIITGAWHFFDEPVSGIRLAGACVVLAGVLLLAFDAKNSSPGPARPPR